MRPHEQLSADKPVKSISTKRKKVRGQRSAAPEVSFPSAASGKSPPIAEFLFPPFPSLPVRNPQLPSPLLISRPSVLRKTQLSVLKMFLSEYYRHGVDPGLGRLQYNDEAFPPSSPSSHWRFDKVGPAMGPKEVPPVDLGHCWSGVCSPFVLLLGKQDERVS